MKNSYAFIRLVLDSVAEDIVVIDELGEIQFFNKSWSNFGNDNACTIQDWEGVNYLEECDKASAMGDDFGTKAARGIRDVIESRESEFYFEYPCHSSDEQRWFLMQVTQFQLSKSHFFVISHLNITQRVLAEEKLDSLARLDGLTMIPNRRAFDDFLQKEWRRCLRIGKPICLAIVDIDYFKLLNDAAGHQAGDECLIKISKLLETFANRPGDLCARYGGDEFVLVWGETSLDQAIKFADKLLKSVSELQIPNSGSPIESYVTVSIGLAENVSGKIAGQSELVSKADNKLYLAKDNGRNRVES